MTRLHLKHDKNYYIGWNNIQFAIALEIAFQKTCNLNDDNFNMYDRRNFLMCSPLYWQVRNSGCMDEKYKSYWSEIFSEVERPAYEGYPFVNEQDKKVYLLLPSIYKQRKRSYYDRIKAGDLEIQPGRNSLYKLETQKTQKYSVIFELWICKNGIKSKVKTGAAAREPISIFDKSSDKYKHQIISAMSWAIKKET